MNERVMRGGVLAGALLTVGLLAVLVINSLSWIGRPFPGFFVMANRVVASITLPEWPNPADLFQAEVIAVQGEAVNSAQDVYAQVARYMIDTPLRYTLRYADGRVTTATFRSREFTHSDYVFLFGSMLLTGAAFIFSGLFVFWLKPGQPASVGLLASCVATGIFGATAVDLYGPHWFFRVHVLGETLLAPGFIYLALVFPTDRLHRYRRGVLRLLYGAFLAFALVYEAVLYRPALYSGVHLIATVAQGCSGVCIIAAVAYDLIMTRSPLVRRRLAVVALGTISGFIVPTLLMTGSGLLGGTIAVNAASLTAFFFPFTLGYAIVKHDLFQIDVMLRRATTYGIVVLTIAGLYFLTLYGMGVLVPGQFSAWSPVVLATLNFLLLFLIASLRERVQAIIDRLFFRQKYRIDQALATLSSSLASARSVGEVVTHTRAVLGESLAPRQTRIFFHGAGGSLREAGGRTLAAEDLVLDADTARRVNVSDVLASYEWDDGSGRVVPEIWRRLDAEILVPVRTNGAPIAVLALAGKSSGRPYSVHDIAFLRTAASQIALALTNALAFGQLEELNANLEHKVRERTGALRATNAELNRSVNKLQEAYGQLERSHASLLRADRLATLGRLTAGIAHEMNTPLSAVLNALKIIAELGQEYAESVDDAAVLPDDHRQIAAEIVSTAQAATAWATKAASYISSVKAHGREARPAVAGTLMVSAVVAETRALLAHRLRASACQIEFEEDPAGITLEGDPGRLGQVLLNLCTNAIDAYEDAGLSDGRIAIRVLRRADVVTLTVADFAGGIPPGVLPHIFDELYTTKGPGRGTGLGLWIARNLVEEGFGGTLGVETTAGLGSLFTATFPLHSADAVTEMVPVPQPAARRPAAVSAVANAH